MAMPQPETIGKNVVDKNRITQEKERKANTQTFDERKFDNLLTLSLLPLEDDAATAAK